MVSEIVFGYVFGGFLGWIGGFFYFEIDFEGESSLDGFCRIYIWISRYF